jgi:hypothetical protein
VAVKQCKQVEVPVMEVEDLYNAGRFVYCKVEGLNIRLCISIAALQHLFEFACKVGILLPQNDTFYVRNGQIRRYQHAKHKETTVEEILGTGKE